MTQIQRETSEQLSFREHLTEFRRRLLYCVVFLAAGMGLGWLYSPQITMLLQHPLSQHLYFNDPAGGLGFVIQISLFAGIIFAIPITVYQLIQFIRPATRKVSTASVVWLVIASLILASFGVAFAYFLSLPAALKFLLSINSSGVSPLISADKYLSFVMTYLASFALIFQLPLILLFINRITPLSGGKLMRYERPVIIFSFVAAAILTPTPDPFNQVIMALPMIILYQVAVLCVVVSNRTRRVKLAPDTASQPVHQPAVSAQPTVFIPEQKPIEPVSTPTALPRPVFATAARPNVIDLSKFDQKMTHDRVVHAMASQANFSKRSMDIGRLRTST